MKHQDKNDLLATKLTKKLTKNTISHFQKYKNKRPKTTTKNPNFWT